MHFYIMEGFNVAAETEPKHFKTMVLLMHLHIFATCMLPDNLSVPKDSPYELT